MTSTTTHITAIGLATSQQLKKFAGTQWHPSKF